MNAVNYQREFEKCIEGFKNREDKPTLLLHSCCAPCSSYCLVYLRQWFDITCFYYNPNITNHEEYNKRIQELRRLAEELNNDPIALGRDDKGQIIIEKRDEAYLKDVSLIKVIDGRYEPLVFTDMVTSQQLENEPEGGKRCVACFSLRLAEAVKVANQGGYDYVTTTLTISPLKNATWLNEIGSFEATKYDGGSIWLPSDFKKKNGYKLSVELSARYDLYRQNYCGCDYSK